MANIIRIKRRVTGAVGAPAALKTAELAWNMADNTLYGGFGDDASGNATSIVPLGGTGTFAVLASPAFTGTPTAPTAAADTNTTQVATTAFVIAQASSSNPIVNGSVAIGSSLKYARADHVHPIDTSRAPLASPGFTGVPTAPTAAVDTNTTQLATTAFVLAQAASVTPLINGTGAVGTSTRFARADHVHPNQRIDQLLAPTTSVAFNAQKITGLADPTLAQDAATKNYVDMAVQGLDAKASVRAATTANITLSAPQTIDGIGVIAGDRVLVKNQTLSQNNGIYIVAAGAWTRALDLDTWAEVPNAFVFVETGTTQADTSWISTADQGGTLNTTAITFTQFGAAGGYSAGDGILLTGAVFSAVGTASRISVGPGGIDIAATYVGQTSITTLGTIGTGTWQGSIVGLAYGGTGTNLSGASDGAIFKKSGTGLVAATVGTDYLSDASTVDGGTF